MRIAHLHLALAAALFTVAPPAIAAGPGDQAAGAALFEEAKKLVAASDYERACPKFVEAQRLFPTAGTLLNLGNCYEKLGKLASAWGAFKEAEVMARNLNDAEREQEASRRAQALTPQLAKLAINVPPATRVPGFELRRDGTVIGEGQWGAAMPVDSGQHTIEARAPGRKPWSTWVRVETNGSSATIEVPALEVLPADAPAGGPPPAFWNGQRIAGVVVGGAGVVGLVIGSVFGAQAIAKKADADEQCLPGNPNVCYPAGIALRHDEKTAGSVSTGAFIAGGALIAGGVVLLLAAPGPSSGKKESIRLHVGPAIAGAGVSVAGRW